MAYTVDSKWRNRSEIFQGRPAIVDTACKDLRDRSGLPRPPLISAMAQRPSVKDHRMGIVYAQTLYKDAAATLDDLREAVDTLEDLERIARRVLGGAHPLTVGIERSLQKARAALRARERPPPARADAIDAR